MEQLLKRTFADALYEKRIELNLSQQKMAERCFLSIRQYSDLENGLRLPSFESLVNISLQSGLNLNKVIDDLVKNGYVGNDNKNSA